MMYSFWQNETGARLKAGENLICSPLRQDRNPSFTVNTASGLWYDFGTGQGGDTIDFIKLKYNYDFRRAKEYLEGHGAVLPDRKPRQPERRHHEKPIQGKREDFTYIEIVRGGYANRGNFEQRNAPDYYGEPDLVDCFHSLYSHSSGIVDFYRTQKNSIAGYRGACWLREMVFDMDFKEKTFLENIETALTETRKLFQKIKSIGTTPAVNFSGQKGFHLRFSLPQLDRLSGFSDTPLYTRRFAEKIGEGIDGIDFKVYEPATHLVRSVNSRRQSGLYAIPLTEAELLTLTAGNIVNLAMKPRRVVSFPLPCFSKLFNEKFTLNSDGCAVFESGAQYTKAEIDMLKTETNKNAIIALHKTKTLFTGTAERTPKNGNPIITEAGH